MHENHIKFLQKRRIWTMPTINFNISSIKESSSSIDIEHKEDPRPHNVQRRRKPYTCVSEARGSGNIFHLITNSTLIKYSLKDKLGKRRKCRKVKVAFSQFCKLVNCAFLEVLGHAMWHFMEYQELGMWKSKSLWVNSKISSLTYIYLLQRCNNVFWLNEEATYYAKSTFGLNLGVEDFVTFCHEGE